MNKKYKIDEILEAVDTLLNSNKSEILVLKESIIKKNNSSEIPNDTEKIIKDAETYLKK